MFYEALLDNFLEQSYQNYLACCHWPCFSLITMYQWDSWTSETPRAYKREQKYKCLIGSTSTGDSNLIIMFNPNHNHIHLNTMHKKYWTRGDQSTLREPYCCLNEQHHHRTLLLLRLMFAAFITLARIDVRLEFKVIGQSEKDGQARFSKKNWVPKLTTPPSLDTQCPFFPSFLYIWILSEYQYCKDLF